MDSFLHRKPIRKEKSLLGTDLKQLEAAKKNKEFSMECDSAELKVDGMHLTFKDGVWDAELCDGMSSTEIELLRRENNFLNEQNMQLLERNNMLKLKIAILLDMLSETTAESHILEKERNDAILVAKKKSKIR